MRFDRLTAKNAFKRWLPLGFAVTLAFLFSYVGIQQMIRLSADDLEVEVAENVVSALSEGTPYKLFDTKTPSAIDKSLSAFVILYDLSRKPLAGTGTLGGDYPVPPRGVFDELTARGEDRFTWEPRPGQRFAVVARYHSGTNPAYVLVGRSLREVESHIQKLGMLMLFFWAIGMIGSFGLTLLLA